MSVSAKSPDGTVWFLYASDETPTLSSVKYPAPTVIRDTVYEDVYFLSQARSAARRWIVSNAGVFSLQVVPITYGRTEYIEFLTPALVSWVVGIDNAGNLYTEQFTSGAPVNRRLVTTVMHKGTLVWVADNRMPIPRER